MSGEFDFIRDLTNLTFYDNIISIFGIKHIIKYVNISYKDLEELKNLRDQDIFNFNLDFDYDFDFDFDYDYDYDYEDKYII